MRTKTENEMNEFHLLLALQHGKTNPMDVGANFVLETAQRIADDYVDSRRYFLQWVIDRQAYLTQKTI